MKKQKPVSILITWDIDPDQWIPFEKRTWALNSTMDMCHQLGIPATFFFTAQPVYQYPQEFIKLKAQGHEIGCHGLTHGSEENYDRMPEDMQRRYLTQATETLNAMLGEPVRAFRGPRVKISATTLKILAELGYTTDSSVCSQRVDFISSNLINLGWIKAPRKPYRPNAESAFKKGQLPIWEVPVSAAILPFISSALRVFGLSFMKSLFRLLYAEAQRTGKPIVYLAHPTEFISKWWGKKNSRDWESAAKLEYLKPSYIRAHGLRLRGLLYRLRAEDMLPYTESLFTYMSSFPNVEFKTMSQWHTGTLPGNHGNREQDNE